MTDHELADSDHVVRYVKFTDYCEDGTINCSAFQLGPTHKGLSVNWLECFGNLTKLDQLEKIRPLIRLKLGGKAKLAELKVGETIEHFSSKVAEFNASNPPEEQIRNNLRFKRTPLCATEEFEADPSHCDIMGISPADSPHSDLIGDMLAECVIELHPAKV